MQKQSPVKLTTRKRRSHLKQGENLPLVAIVPVGRLREENIRISELRIVT